MNWENGSVEDLREVLISDDDSITSRRLFCMIKLSEGRSVSDVASFMEVSPSSIQRWIRVFNESGVEGLLARGNPGRKRSITVEQFNENVVPLLEDEDSQHWTVVQIHAYLRDKGLIDCSYSSLLRIIHENNYSLVIPRPTHPDIDEQARKEFIEQLNNLDNDPNTIIYFGDEVGFEGDPRPRRKWVKRGTKPTSPRTGSHIRMSVIGAVSPMIGDLFSLIVPQTDTDIFQTFLDEFAKATIDKHKDGKKIVLILDNASWHKSSKLEWYHIQPCYLPPYSPDLNPIEQLWKEIKSHWMPNYFARTKEELTEKLVNVLKNLTFMKDTISSVTSYTRLIKT